MHAQDGLAHAHAIAKMQHARADAGYTFLQTQAKTIKDPAIRAAAIDVLMNPAPTFMERLATPEAKEAARKALVDAGLLAPDVTVEQLFPPLTDPHVAPMPFMLTGAGPLQHHHAWPGGLPEHEAFNLQSALDLEKNYKQRDGVVLDHDLIVAAPIFHDAMKPWALQWKADGTLTIQATIADTGSHHVFGVAEALHRKLPADLVIAIASAHDSPSLDTAPRVVNYLRAGAILAGVDPVAAGLLVPVTADGMPKDPGRLFALPHAPAPAFEWVIDHLSDHDYMLTDPAHATDWDVLGRLAPKADDDAAARWMRIRVETLAGGMAIYEWWLLGGDDRVRRELAARKIPLDDPSDRATSFGEK